MEHEQHSYYGEQEEINQELRITLTASDEEDVVEDLRNVKSPADIVRLGAAHGGENIVYESLDAGKFQAQQADFFSLFSNRFASRMKRGKEGAWIETSQFHFLSNQEIIEAISGSTGFLRACMADAKTRFVAITLEAGSFYRSPEGMEKIRDCFRCIGINQLKLYKYEESEEWTMYAFFKDAVSSPEISVLLSSWLRRNGIVPGTAGVNMFPGPDPFCLPLQTGFCWINDDGQVIVARNQISVEAALALFISDVDRTAIDAVELMERLPQILS